MLRAPSQGLFQGRTCVSAQNARGASLAPHPCEMRILVLSVLAMVVALAPATAEAQCGAKRSTCSTCHTETSAGPWHRDHAFADLCAACHGGDPDATEIAAAHVGLEEPRCATCHADGRRYDVDAGAAPSSSPPVEPHGRFGANVVATIVAITLAGGFVVLLERRRTSCA